MGRLIDSDELKGCAIIKPRTHEEMEHINACKNLLNHFEIPTAYDVKAVCEQLVLKGRPLNPDEHYITVKEAIEIVRRGGVNSEKEN